MASADHPSILIVEGVELTQRAGHSAGGGQNVAPCVIGIGHHLRAAAVDQPGHVALCILQVEILRAVVGDGHGADLIVGKMQSCAAGGCRNIDLRQRVTEVGVACPRSLACVDDLAAGVADVVNAWLGLVQTRCTSPLLRAVILPVNILYFENNNTNIQPILQTPSVKRQNLFCRASSS